MVATKKYFGLPTVTDESLQLDNLTWYVDVLQTPAEVLMVLNTSMPDPCEP
jgi:hypothetical protein